MTRPLLKMMATFNRMFLSTQSLLVGPLFLCLPAYSPSIHFYGLPWWFSW